MNQELFTIFEEDQADRRGDLPQDLAARDQARRRRVEQLITTDALQEPEDYFHAAMVFQHGGIPDDSWRAHELAKRAAELGHHSARWLAAAAYDRWLMQQHKPQKYGTQYVAEGDHWRLYDVDPATTDAERADWDVPPLEIARKRAEDLTRARPPVRGGHVAGAVVGRLELADLRVEVILLNQVGTPPVPEPLSANEDAPVPADLPEGVEIRRRGIGYCAIAPDGRLVLFWDRQAVPAGAPFVYGWRWAKEDLLLEPIEVAGRPAIRIAGAGDGLERLVVRSDRATWWLVGGCMTREELARIAAGLPLGT